MLEAEVAVTTVETKTVPVVPGRIILWSNGIGTINCIAEGVNPQRGSDFCHTIPLEPKEVAEALSLLQSWSERVMASRKFFGGKGSASEVAEDAQVAAELAAEAAEG